MHVTTLAASPGMLTRIEVVEPPYMAPYQTPVIMIKQVVGPYGKVKGSISTIVAVGPKPGRTPTRVPTKAPMKQATRFTIARELINPLNRRPNPSIVALLSQNPSRQVDIQPVIEQQIDKQSRPTGHSQRLPPPLQLHDLAKGIGGEKRNDDITQERHRNNPETECQGHEDD